MEANSPSANEQATDADVAIELSILSIQYHAQLKTENAELLNELNRLEKEKAEQEAELCRLRESIHELSKYDQSVEDDEQPYQSKFFSEFEVKRIIGDQGRYGTIVFECVSQLTKASIAIKRIQTVNPSKEVMSRALREVRATSHFDQPGIVRYNSTWIEKPPIGFQSSVDIDMLRKIQSPRERLNMNYIDESVFIYTEMELCENSLADWLDYNQTNRDLELMKDFFPQVVSALDFIHGRGIIHRNLKPSNILFTPEILGKSGNYSQGKLKISDLGVVADRVIKSGEEVARTELFPKETQMYMAPEQKEDGYSSKVDIFALGLLLIELSVVLTKEEAELIFNDYRAGTPNRVLDDLPDTKKFVAWLTNLDPVERPECKQILEHEFLEKTTFEL